MAKTSKEVDEYILEQTPERQEALRRVRALILETITGIKETMRYCMPTYGIDEVVCALASQKHYLSLYMDVDLVEKHSEELDHLDVGKSCICFKRVDDLPMETVRQILVETVEGQGGALNGERN